MTTIPLFALQILHGNTACSQVPRLGAVDCTGEAYCQARQHLPLAVLRNLVRAVSQHLGATTLLWRTSLRRASRTRGWSWLPNSVMIFLSRSGSKMATDSERVPSEGREQPSFFCTFLSSLACWEAAERSDDRVEKEQGQEHAVLVVVQRSIACAIALTANVVQAREQRGKLNKILEALQILRADLGLGRAGRVVSMVCRMHLSGRRRNTEQMNYPGRKWRAEHH